MLREQKEMLNFVGREVTKMTVKPSLEKEIARWTRTFWTVYSNSWRRERRWHSSGQKQETSQDAATAASSFSSHPAAAADQEEDAVPRQQGVLCHASRVSRERRVTGSKLVRKENP